MNNITESKESYVSQLISEQEYNNLVWNPLTMKQVMKLIGYKIADVSFITSWDDKDKATGIEFYFKNKSAKYPLTIIRIDIDEMHEGSEQVLFFSYAYTSTGTDRKE